MPSLQFLFTTVLLSIPALDAYPTTNSHSSALLRNTDQKTHALVSRRSPESASTPQTYNSNVRNRLRLLRRMDHGHGHQPPHQGPPPVPHVPHVMRPEQHPQGHRQHVQHPSHAPVLHGSIPLDHHPDLGHPSQIHHVAQQSYHHVSQGGFNAHNNHHSGNALVSGYHGGGLTHNIHLSTIPSHGQGTPATSGHIMKHRYKDPTYAQEHTPMLHQAYQHVKAARPNDVKDFPHAEMGAIGQFEESIHHQYGHIIDAEGRRQMAAQHFDRSNLATHGKFRDGHPAHAGPCGRQCQPILNHMERQRQDIRDEEARYGGGGQDPIHLQEPPMSYPRPGHGPGGHGGYGQTFTLPIHPPPPPPHKRR